MASVLSHPSPWCFWRRQDALPMCVVTGQHMVKEDWCICPRSRMPALMSHYESYLQYEQVRGSFHRQTKLFRSAFLCCLCLSFSLVPFEPPPKSCEIYHLSRNQDTAVPPQQEHQRRNYAVD